MKSLWTTISFLAVVHLLALAMFAGWLWKTGRLDGERIRELRTMFSMTVAEAQAARAEAALEAESQHQADEEAAMRRRPPVSSAERIVLVSQSEQRARQSMRRMEDEQRLLMDQLAREREQLEVDRARHQEQVARWAQSTEAERRRQADEQFAKAVKLLESQPPKLAKRAIVELINGGKTEEAVAYLDAMNERKAGKVLAEFKTDQDAKLATELLERLRTFGVGADVASESGNDTAAPRSS